ncbi:MAG: SdrD B-like domain-containing protein, partial [Pseudomonadota bacterium]
GTATFGDLVWSDFDSDGVRDTGEPGLTGVTVQLWQDDGDLLWDPGTDTLITSTVTAAGGSYLFTGVTPTGTEDYFSFVDPTQAALTGFTSTTVDPLLVQNVNAGDVILTLDFGFRNAAGTYTITDRVWYDANGDSEDDGESGIGGVTVDLLDASLNVIASTITDANGYFSFNGVIGSGADYTVRITDTGSKLNDYYGITAGAIAGEVEIINLSGNLDYTLEPTEPNFGYGLSKSISGTVFNDLDGDGSLDAGETGMSGIDISLYNDVNSDGLLDGGDTLESTLPTDSNGNYLFSGLDNGNYIVSIPSPPSNYDYTTEIPDNDPAAGDQQTATIVGGGNVQNVNFGYEAQDPRGISGTLWEDDDADGVIDAGENGLEGVTIDLLDGSTVVASTSTDSNGDYSFSGLTPITYTVRITDTLGVLSGYETTYEFDPPFDGEGDADLSGGDETGADFGYREPVVTLIILSSFRAYEDRGRVVIEWTTSSEVDTAGFYLLRLDKPTGEYTRINSKLLPALLTSPQGGTY